MQPPMLSAPERNALVTNSSDAAATMVAGRPSTSFLREKRAPGTPKKAAPSTCQALVVSPQLSREQRQVPTASRSLQPRCDLAAVSAAVCVQTARSVTNNDWLNPLCSLERQRQTAAEAYTPFTIAAVEAEAAQRARLVLATIQPEWDSCGEECAPGLSDLPPLHAGSEGGSPRKGGLPQLSLSAKARQVNDGVTPSQKYLSCAGIVGRMSFDATESQPRQVTIDAPRSRQCQSSSRLSAASAITWGCSPDACTDIGERELDASVVDVHAPSPTHGAPEHISSLPVIPSVSASDDRRRNIPGLYARLHRLLKGYSTPDRHLSLTSSVMSDEATAAFPYKKATTTFPTQSPPMIKADGLVHQRPAQLSRRSSLTHDVLPNRLSLPHVSWPTHLSLAQVCRPSSFTNLTRSTSGEANSPLTTMHDILYPSITARSQPQPQNHPPTSGSHRFLLGPFSSTHGGSTGTLPYMREKRLQRHCAHIIERRLHSLLEHEEHQRAHITIDAQRALGTIHALHNSYCKYLELWKRQQAAAAASEAAHDKQLRLADVYPQRACLRMLFDGRQIHGSDTIITCNQFEENAPSTTARPRKVFCEEHE